MKMTTKLVNLTPHTIVLVGPDGAPALTVAPSGTIARATEDAQVSRTAAVSPDVGDAVEVDVVDVAYTAVEGLPPVGPSDPATLTCYVVSSVVAQACYALGRPTHDLLVPGQQVRDAEGRIVGCRSLQRFSPPTREQFMRELRRWTRVGTQDEYGYAADEDAMASFDKSGQRWDHKAALVAETLLESICPAPAHGAPVAHRAVGMVMEFVEEAHRRDRASDARVRARLEEVRVAELAAERSKVSKVAALEATAGASASLTGPT